MPCFHVMRTNYILLERTRDSVFISMYMYTPETRHAPRFVRYQGGSAVRTPTGILVKGRHTTLYAGETTEERGVAFVYYVYVHKARMPTTNRIYPPPSASLHPSVASYRSSIQIASPLSILNLWYAHCALLILYHAYASWILQRSRKE